MIHLPEGYEAYQPMADKILNWTKEWVSQDEFDDLARKEILAPCSVIGIKVGTVVLSWNGGLDDWIVLLQMMGKSGFLKAKKRKDGVIYYRRAA